MRHIALFTSIALLPLAGSLGGCNAYRLDAPAGFAQARESDDGVHFKANNNVGLRVTVLHNVDGGTLTFWSRDLVEKLGKRDYQLVSQQPARSKNRVAGTRFDFTYTPVGEGEGLRFYTVVLFTTDKYRVVLDMAGRDEFRAQYTAQIDEIASEMKVRGCKLGSKICKGPQPETLSTPPPAAEPTEQEPTTDDAPPAEPAKAEPAKAEPAKAEPEPSKAKPK